MRGKHVLRRDALEIGTHAYVFAEVLEREDLSGGIDGCVNAGILGDLDDLVERNDVGVFRRLLNYRDVNCTGLVGDGGSNVILGGAVFVARKNEFCSGELEASVVPILLAVLHHDLVLQTRCIG